jgi:hypothetical protein
MLSIRDCQRLGTKLPLPSTKTERDSATKNPVAKVIINAELVKEISIAPDLIGIMGTIWNCSSGLLIMLKVFVIIN